MWSGGATSEKVRVYLASVGFHVPAVDRSAAQRGLECGVASAWTACALWGAPDWRTAIVRDAVDARVIAAANREACLFPA